MKKTGENKVNSVHATTGTLDAARLHLSGKIIDNLDEDGVLQTAIPGIALYRRSSPTQCSSAHYTPQLIVFVQGEKRIDLGGAELECTGKNFLLTSVDMPVVSQVTRASRKEPILAMLMKIDMPVVREILSQQEFLSIEAVKGFRGMAVGKNTVELLSACSRLLDLLHSPDEIGFLGPLIQREIYYRVLRGPEGKHLRAIATLGEQSQRTAKAVAWLRENYSQPLRVEDLADVAQMGVSTLHHHFRSLTAMSPLQYQKRLRLHVARERIMTQGIDAASAAFEVGYESASQFNREYKRFFGQPPMRDLRRLKELGVELRD